MNILCKYEDKIKVHFFYLFVYLENTCIVCSSIQGTITFILKH